MCIKFTSWDVLAVLISHQVTGPEPIGSFHYLKKNQFKLQAPEVNLPANSRSLSVSLSESSSHFFFIMIRAGAENMVATPLASTRSGLSGDALSFKTKFTM